ncbi:hypothetical protein AS9A_2920 [Hoyosella subflava DQS3-9A1]|uniref:Uncharacterized protein n=1 Tax=Hoyosella subflava (strain DSM 45089 / JCM 17490 / NBRC 109087 / DQS3-9A1) TaxID=443218 RepID=F6EK09_HOYSD|nr:hypothetical protein AS9A_2920 [Hoyosella subflava DQS3-9A1]
MLMMMGVPNSVRVRVEVRAVVCEAVDVVIRFSHGQILGVRSIWSNHFAANARRC